MEEITRVDLIVHPFFGFFPLLYHTPEGIKEFLTQYETIVTGDNIKVSPERYAKRLGDYWGRLIKETENSKGRIVVIVKQSDRTFEIIEKARLSLIEQHIPAEKREKAIRIITECFRKMKSRQQRLLEFARRTIGDRLLIANDTISGSIYDLKRTLEKRGFRLTNNTKVYGCGEVSTFCVKTNLYRFGEMFKIPKENLSIVKEGTEQLSPKIKKRIIRITKRQKNSCVTKLRKRRV